MSVLVDRGEVWTVTLDRPERANALSVGLVEALHGVLDEAAVARPDALVLRGGARHFAAGFDLGGLDSETDASLAHRFLRIGLLLERLATAPYGTVAVVEGTAVGAGADLVTHCDHRLLAPSVTLRFPGSAFGVVLGTQRHHVPATGTPDRLAAALAAPAPARAPYDADAAYAALARSVAAPGLRDRLAAYAQTTRVKENA